MRGEAIEEFKAMKLPSKPWKEEVRLFLLAIGVHSHIHAHRDTHMHAHKHTAAHAASNGRML